MVLVKQPSLSSNFLRTLWSTLERPFPSQMFWRFLCAVITCLSLHQNYLSLCSRKAAFLVLLIGSGLLIQKKTNTFWIFVQKHFMINSKYLSFRHWERLLFLLVLIHKKSHIPYSECLLLRSLSAWSHHVSHALGVRRLLKTLLIRCIIV